MLWPSRLLTWTALVLLVPRALGTEQKEKGKIREIRDGYFSNINGARCIFIALRCCRVRGRGAENTFRACAMALVCYIHLHLVRWDHHVSARYSYILLVGRYLINTHDWVHREYKILRKRMVLMVNFVAFFMSCKLDNCGFVLLRALALICRTWNNQTLFTKKNHT